jgi:hypothetical protein
VELAIGDMDKRWDIAAQVEQRMQFDGCFGLPEMCPWKDRKEKGKGVGDK